MIKKIIPVVLCLCLSFAVICYGENTAETPKMQMPQNGEMPQMGERPSRGEMPSFGQTQDMQNTAESKGFFEEYFDAIVSVILLILAYLFVIFYKRRQY